MNVSKSAVAYRSKGWTEPLEESPPCVRCPWQPANDVQYLDKRKQNLWKPSERLHSLSGQVNTRVEKMNDS